MQESNGVSRRAQNGTTEYLVTEGESTSEHVQLDHMPLGHDKQVTEELSCMMLEQKNFLDQWFQILLAELQRNHDEPGNEHVPRSVPATTDCLHQQAKQSQHQSHQLPPLWEHSEQHQQQQPYHQQQQQHQLQLHDRVNFQHSDWDDTHHCISSGSKHGKTNSGNSAGNLDPYYSEDVLASAKHDLDAFHAICGWSKTIKGAKDASWKELALLERAHRLSVKKIDKISAFLVIINTVFVGIQMDLCLDAVSKGGAKPVWLWYADNLIMLAFVVELLTKLWLQRLQFFTGDDRRWNIFDAVLVVSSIVDALVVFADISFLRFLRMAQAIRAIRVLKCLRFVKDLRLMLTSIACSASCLFWAFVLLSCVLYLFAVFIMQGILYFLEHHNAKVNEFVLTHYGTVLSTMISLFMAISGGMDWYELVTPLHAFSEWYTCIYVFYMLFVLFGILNILTAIFVEGAHHLARLDRDVIMNEQMSNDASTINELKRVFQEFDSDGSNTIDLQEFERLLQDERTMQHLKALDLDLTKARGLFTLLDLTGDGKVAADEFVSTLMRLQGAAKAVDLQTIIYENKRQMAHMIQFMKSVQWQLHIQSVQLGIEKANLNNDAPDSSKRSL